jgi:dTDP-4-dehydrorhamnose reductase
MKIVILGSSGMLGSMLVFVGKKRGLNVQSIGRQMFDVLRDPVESLDALIQSEEGGVCFINCIGCIPQRKYSYEDYKKINEEFPKYLAAYCQSHNFGLIHISTNCVFKGDKPYCKEDDLLTAEDTYGKTKGLGEPSYGIVLRASIIGPEKHSSFGLLAWFLKNSASQIQGYTQQFWNGLTTLELSSCIYDEFLEKSWGSEIVHLYSSRTLSKYELLSTCKDIFAKEILIEPYIGDARHYTLSSSKLAARKDIEEQLHDLSLVYNEFMSNM